ncbi:MAG: hypothetical protein Q9208_001463 [Pyrenodesmia sp. 3 TL-2023]
MAEHSQSSCAGTSNTEQHHADQVEPVQWQLERCRKALEEAAQQCSETVSKLNDGHVNDVTLMLENQKKELRKSHEAELERQLREQKKASDEATSKLTQAYAAKIKSLQSDLAKSKKELDEAKGQRETGSSPVQQGSATLEHSLREATEQKTRLWELLGICLDSVTGFSLDSDLVEDMIQLHIRSEGLRQVVMDSESTIGLPRLSFVPDTTGTRPLIHAMAFWTNARADRLSFESTQALFNASRIGPNMAPLYPWVLAALQASLDCMPSWGDDLLAFKRILTTLQGIMFLGILAHKSGIATDAVRTLHATVETYLAGQNAIGSEPFVRGILAMLAASLDGRAPRSWIADGTASDANGIPRLDATNSGIGANRCLFAAGAGKIYVLLDAISVNETLYMFTVDDVETLSTTGEPSWHVQLDLVDSHVANRISRHLILGLASTAMWTLLGHISADKVR